jgi:protoporphyrinogen oxidase
MPNVVIVGAGPGGLTAAYELTKLGINATVLESDSQVGGLSRTVSYNGYRFDIGGHRFYNKVPLIEELWHEILGEEFLQRPRLSRIHYRGRLFDYPLKPLNALAGLGVLESALVCASYAKAKVAPARDEVTFEQWVSNRFGHRLYETFFKTYTEKVWGIPCSQISADWAAQRIRNLSLYEALKNAILKNGRDGGGEIVTSLIDSFHYPRLGPGMMWERCADLVEERGGKVLCDVRVDRIRHRDGRVQGVEAHHSSGERFELPADSVISTMPMRDLMHALDPLPPADVLQSADALGYRDYLTVVLIVKREEVFRDNWIYIHSPEVRVGRVQNYKNWSPWLVPDASRTSLGLEYFLWNHDPQWTWSPQQLIEHGIRELAQIGLVDPSEVEDGTIVRMPRAYPLYDRDYAEHVAALRRHLATIGNLQTIGRNGQHRYNNQDHSMLAGVFAARNLAGENLNVWDVNTDSEYQEEVSAPRKAERLVPSPIFPSAAADLSPEQIVEAAFARVDAVALGAAFGITGALGLLGVTAMALSGGNSDVIGTLTLLSQYLIGYGVDWRNLWIGVLETAAGGFALGYATAGLRNWTLGGYAEWLRWRAQRAERRRLLDEV